MPTIERELTPKLKTFVTQTVSEILNDPDFGLELTEYAKKRLRKARLKTTKTIPLEEIKKEFS